MFLICGFCKKKTKSPKLSKDGKRAKCGRCGRWQEFEGRLLFNAGKNMTKKIKLVLTEFEAKTWLNGEWILPVSGPERSALTRVVKKIKIELHRRGLD